MLEQKEEYLQVIQKLNDTEIEVECHLTFDRQEREKEKMWDIKKQK